MYIRPVCDIICSAAELSRHLGEREQKTLCGIVVEALYSSTTVIQNSLVHIPVSLNSKLSGQV